MRIQSCLLACSSFILPLNAVAAEQEAPLCLEDNAPKYQRWEQLPAEVRSAVLFIMAANFEGLASAKERHLSCDSAEAQILLIQEVLKLDTSFIKGADREYFDTMLAINKSRMKALQALTPPVAAEDVKKIRAEHAAQLDLVKELYGYKLVDEIIMQQLNVMQQKHMQACIVANPHSPFAVLRMFAEKLREESIMQH